MKKHTQEPWIIGEVEGDTYIYNDDTCEQPNGKFRMICKISSAKDHDELDDLNAQRIVDCVNAMEGIEKPQKLRNAWEVTKKFELDQHLVFKEKVRAMRAAQKGYFKHRTKDLLAESKRLEIEVDHMLNNEKTLFDGY